MKEYENFTNDVIPSILALVVKHEEIPHEKLVHSVKTAKPIRMTYRKFMNMYHCSTTPPPHSLSHPKHLPN